MTSKEEVQDYVVKHANHKLIILEHATGLGKSFSSLKLIRKFNPARILLLVAEIHHKQNWLDEFSKFQKVYNEILISPNRTLIIECYASLHKFVDTEWDMVIMDESHHLSEYRLESLASIKATHFIALSATLTQDDKDNLRYAIGVGTDEVFHSRINLKRAVDMGILPKAKVHLFPLTLNNTIVSEEYIQARGSTKNRKIIYCSYEKRFDFLNNKGNFPDLELHIKCTPLQKYQMIDANMEYWKQFYMRTRQDFSKFKWLGLGSERKRFLAEIKNSYVKKLITELGSTRLICFCGSIEQADALGGELSLHSKKPKDNTILEDFQNKKTNSIFVVGMVVEGQNLVDIEAGIIVQLDGTERPFIQKSGRILRSDDPEQYIFYYKDTQDEVFLNRIIEGIPSESIEIIEDIDAWER